ncbi:hypothetical protein IAR50_001915 [Cryptococcus sp. DSM 104548]
MPNYYDELEIEDFAWDPVANLFHYPCPCGDRFEISKGQLRDGEEIAICPSCSLIVRVIYDYLDWEDYVTSDEEDAGADEEYKEEGVSEETTPETSVSPPAEAAETVQQKPASPDQSPDQSPTGLAVQLGDSLKISEEGREDREGGLKSGSHTSKTDR